MAGGAERRARAALGAVLAALVATASGCGRSREVAPAAARSVAAPRGAATAPQGASGLCAKDACAAPVVRGVLVDADLDEVSGLVASALHRRIVYAHNDSGDGPRFFALEPSGLLRGTYVLAGARAVDWEDVARGPCDRGSCLYFADLGDNRERRTDYTIYRVAEPSSFGPGARDVPAEVLPVRYPDGSHNAETLLVHPTTGVVTIVTKVASGASGVYELPAPPTPGAPATLVRRGTIEPPSGSPRFTGGDVHPKGRGVLLRTYTSVLFHAMDPGESVAEALARPPCALPAPPERQGEAIAWLPEGEGYMTIGEGIGASVYEVRCAAGAP